MQSCRHEHTAPDRSSVATGLCRPAQRPCCFTGPCWPCLRAERDRSHQTPRRNSRQVVGGTILSSRCCSCAHDADNNSQRGSTRKRRDRILGDLGTGQCWRRPMFARPGTQLRSRWRDFLPGNLVRPPSPIKAAPRIKLRRRLKVTTKIARLRTSSISVVSWLLS